VCERDERSFISGVKQINSKFQLQLWVCGIFISKQTLKIFFFWKMVCGRDESLCMSDTKKSQEFALQKIRRHGCAVMSGENKIISKVLYLYMRMSHMGWLRLVGSFQ